jgi:hypothetical protein
MAQAEIHPRIQHGSGQPELGFGQQRQIRRQNADNRQAGAVHPDGAPDDVPIAAEIPLPQSIPEDRHLRQIHLLIRGNKVPPEQRTHTQAVKETGGGDGSEHLLRFVPGEIRQAGSVAHGR